MYRISLLIIFLLAVTRVWAIDYATESARSLPVAADVDVVVVGGSTGAVAAAVAAARAGASVFLVAPRPYLGEDMAGTLRLWLEPGEVPTSEMGMAIFPDGSLTTPMTVKKALDDALITAGVEYRFNCTAVDILRDVDGAPAGIIMTNRNGRQAVRAKAIIDATDYAWVARQAGLKFSDIHYPSLQTFTRVVVGGEIKISKEFSARILPQQIVEGDKKFPLIEYTLKLPLTDNSYLALNNAEHRARDLTYAPEQARAADSLFAVPLDNFVNSVAPKNLPVTWPGVAGIPLTASAETPYLYIVGGCVEIPRDWAAKLLRPLNLLDYGTRIGTAAATAAKIRPALQQVSLSADMRTASVKGDLKEPQGYRTTVAKLPALDVQARTVPVLAEYDVVVIGGGVSGCPAGIAAARQGVRTLVVEALYGLGGVGTQGGIPSYYYGNPTGFTAEVPPPGRFWDIAHKMEWWRTTLRQSGADVWYGTQGCGALVEDGRVTGVIVATAQGRTVVRAKVVVDASGSADIAVASGAASVYIDGTDIAVQGAGLPAFGVHPVEMNTDFTLADETDTLDTWQLLVTAKKNHPQSYDIGQLLDTRERRRIVGDFTVTVLDQVNGRRYPDTIAQANAPFDTHGYTVDPYFILDKPEGYTKILHSYIPYRCLLPRGLEGILVTGLGISVHRDAVPVMRMQPDIQNQGYAAGAAAAFSVQLGYPPRKLDVRLLQRHLVAVGCLPAGVLRWEDTFPLSNEKMATAVQEVLAENANVAILLTDTTRSIPLLRSSYANAKTEKEKLAYAKILAVLGDTTGIDTIISALEKTPWDQGWNYTAMGQFGSSISEVDSLVQALGRTKDVRALPVIFTKAKALGAGDAFSHFRAVALALESIGDKSAARPLVNLLAQPGLTGYSIKDIGAAWQREFRNDSDNLPRARALRELMLARALYRCGDYNNMGREVLENYSNDLRSHFSRHARAVLGRIVEEKTVVGEAAK